MGKLESGVVVADRFRLERLIGRGGMGEVWRAHHLALDVPCALKVIDDRSADDAEYRARFQQEAQAAARLRHPNVVQVLDHGVWGDMPWIAMELLDGESLADRLERVGRLSLIETLAVVGDIASALERARGLGIVHRDLKPENILLTPEGAKLLDFGVAKLSRGALEGAKTATGVFLGTPQYCSPEQAHGARDVDHRSDLWSLAIVVFEAVTGARPFDGDGMGEVLAAVLTKKPPCPSSIEPSLPAALDGWWSRATASEPAERFQTAAELADALRAVVDASGATAGPPPSPRGRRPHRRAPLTRPRFERPKAWRSAPRRPSKEKRGPSRLRGRLDPSRRPSRCSASSRWWAWPC